MLLTLPTLLYAALLPSAVWLVLRSGPAAQAAGVLAVVAAGLTAGGWYYRLRRFEATGVVYEWLGVRLFRRFVVQGDYFNRLGRRTGFNPAPAWSAGVARAAERSGGQQRTCSASPPSCDALTRRLTASPGTGPG